MLEKKMRNVIVQSMLLVSAGIFCVGGAAPTIDAYTPPPDNEAPREPAIPNGGRMVASVELSQAADIQQESSAYNPPDDNEAPINPAVPGGIRGDCDDLVRNNAQRLPFTTLAPKQHVGATLSTQPTLTWFSPDDEAHTISLDLYQYRDSQWKSVFFGREIAKSQSGFMSYTLPDDTTLEVDGLYLWMIKLQCDPDDPSSWKESEASFRVDSLPVDWAGVQGERIQQATQYMQAGFWYDAIALLVTSPLTEAEWAYRRELLVGLADFDQDLAEANTLTLQEALDSARAEGDESVIDQIETQLDNAQSLLSTGSQASSFDQLRLIAEE